MNFGYHTINLFIRFLLELITFCAVGFYGYSTQTGFYRYVLMIFLPTILALVWGVFATPNDKSRSGKTIIKTPGIIRLILELVIFGCGALAMYLLQLNTYCLIFSIIVILHYLISIDRVKWLVN